MSMGLFGSPQTLPNLGVNNVNIGRAVSVMYICCGAAVPSDTSAWDGCIFHRMQVLDEVECRIHLQVIRSCKIKEIEAPITPILVNQDHLQDDFLPWTITPQSLADQASDGPTPLKLNATKTNSGTKRRRKQPQSSSHRPGPSNTLVTQTGPPSQQIASSDR